MNKTQSKLVTAPSEDPVTLATVKGFLRIDNSDDDTLIGALIKAAVKKCEAYTDQKFITQTWDIYFDRFPFREAPNSWWDGVREGIVSDLYVQAPNLDLPFGPMQSVTALNTYADDGVANTFDASNYNVDTVGPFGRISLKMGSIWPPTILRVTNSVQVRAVFGYGLAASVPDDIKHAILLTVSKFFENRGDDTSGEFFGFSGFDIPPTAKSLLESYRRLKVG